MPIRIRTDIDFGSTWYLKNDPEQLPYILTEVVIVPGNQLKFRLSYFGDIVEIYDFEASLEKKDIDCSEDLEL